MSQVELVIVPKTKDLGDNFVVRRALPAIKKRLLGPFIFWDHMGPVTLAGERNMVVRAHPHIGLSTLTYLFSGEIMHRDSLGNKQPIRPGEVNWMTAGRGIAHSERASAPAPDTSLELEGIQLWIALPVASEKVEPSFVHFKEDTLPLIEGDGLRLRLIAGRALGEVSPVPVFSPLFYMSGEASAGSHFHMDLAAEEEGAVYVVQGKISIEESSHERFSLICFKKGGAISFEASSDCQVMIFGGEVFPEARHIWWNFVASSQEAIEQAKQDWLDDKFGQVVDEAERIPLPDR